MKERNADESQEPQDLADKNEEHRENFKRKRWQSRENLDLTFDSSLIPDAIDKD